MIDKIITLEMAPVLPISKVEAKALGISATIPEKIIKEIPFPIPLAVICSPNHITRIVPVSKVIVVTNLKYIPASKTRPGEFSKLTDTPKPWIKASNTVPYLVYCVIFLLPYSPWFLRFLKYSVTPVNNWIIIDAEIYGIIPKVRIAIRCTAPPANTLNIPSKLLSLPVSRFFNASGSIPGMGT